MTTWKIDHNHLFGDLAKIEKYFVGYDGMLRRMQDAHETMTKAIPNYPPYNIAKVDDNKYVIEMAVAGFGKQQLNIELANNTLVISGDTSSNSEDASGAYLYKGIADRSFSRTFNIADTVEIKNAELINGMLKVWLENIIPDSKKPKKIEINDPQSDTTPSAKQMLTEEK
jgi:molecular chaperone IbpA